MTQYSYEYNEKKGSISIVFGDEIMGYITDERQFYPTGRHKFSSNDIAEIHNVQLNFLFIKRYLLENEKA